MAKKPTITNITSGYQATETINDNFTNVRNSFDNTLSLDGSTPNAMNADLDMNSNDILNAGSITTDTLILDGVNMNVVQEVQLNIADITTVANNITDVNLVADNISGINNVSAAITNGDLINDVYQGAHSANPTVRLDGSALQNGDIYWNTSLNLMRTYSNGSWYNTGAGGSTDASLVSYLQAGTGAVSRSTEARLRECVSLKDFGAVGDGVTDDTVKIQAAVTYCIQNGKALFVPAGTYIVKPATGTNTHTGTASQIRLDFLTADGQGLTMFGEGRGKSIFKEADGETAIGGKFTRMFICLMSATTYRLGSFTFMDLTFDKNGFSNGPAPTPIAWEGAHIISFAGNSGAPSLDCLTFQRIELRDKVGAGIVAGPANVDFKNLVISDVISHDLAGYNAGYYEQKGCIEIAIDCENAVIENVNCFYSQIEPTAVYDANRIRRYKVANSRIDFFQYSDNGVLAGNITSTFMDITGLYAPRQFQIRGVTVNCSNSRLKIDPAMIENFFIDSRFVNCEWLLNYDAATKVVTPWINYTPTNWNAIGLASICTLVNCTFTIDAATVDPTTTGYALRADRVGDGTYSPRTVLIGCSFDRRLYGTLDGYNYGGHWVFDSCKMAGHTLAAQVGAVSSIFASFEFNNCDFSAVTGNYIETISRTAFTLKISGTYLASAWKETYTINGAAGSNQAYYYGKPTLIGDAAPTTGTWMLGAKVYANTPTAGGVEGWVCTAPGTPGTWKAFGSIAV